MRSTLKIILLCVLCFSLPKIGFAEEQNIQNTTSSAAATDISDNPDRLLAFLSVERTNLKNTITNFKPFAKPKSEAEFLHLLQQNQAMIALNQAKAVSFESFLVHQKKLQADFAQRIKQLQQFPETATPQTDFQEKLQKINKLADVNKNAISVINDNLALVANYQDLLRAENKDLNLWKSEILMQERLNNLQKQEDGLKESLTKLLENSLKLQQDTSANADFKASYLLETRILLNDQLISLNQYKRSEINLLKKLARADFSLLKSPDIRTLETITEIYKNAISQFSDIEQALKKMLNVLKAEEPHLRDLKLRQQFATLKKIIYTRISGLTIQEQTLQEDLENHELALKQQMSVRKNLSEYRLDSWPLIMKQIAEIPKQFYAYLKSLSLKTWENYLWHDTMLSTFMLMTLFGIAAIFYAIHKFLKRITQDKERSRMSAHLYDGVLIVLSRNWPYLSGMGLVWVLLYGNQVAFPNYQLLVKLFFVWMTFRTILIMASLSLIERLSDASGKDVYLYKRIKWLILTGAWISALMVFSHELPLSLLLQDLFNRLFMLFLVVVSVFFWFSQELIKHLLGPLLDSKKPYLRNAIKLLLILTPLTLFVIAMIGLIGYINLAWTMSRYQVQVLLIISSYVVIRGVLFDALELLSEWMIGALKNGWLWIEVVLKPLDKILRVVLLFTSLFILIRLFENGSESKTIPTLMKLGGYPLTKNIAGIQLTGNSILEFIVAAAIVMWLSKWTREFCFRWLYRNTADAGVRNSISVFTQYAVILVGGFIALHILGVDFSGMAMVIGGLAVGMGFGLRDFASNVVGGLMLLIERPVREGDLITIGAFEGRVAHIGLRSMRVNSWDNMEVLIPNAETFNKPFTNWTHQEGVVRTVIPIKVSREDDPVMVQQLILDVLATTPEISADPPMQVFLKQIDDALLEFEVRYFVDVNVHTLFEIRSKVLFAVMAKFKSNNIKAPVPPMHIEFCENKGSKVRASNANLQYASEE